MNLIGMYYSYIINYTVVYGKGHVSATLRKWQHRKAMKENNTTWQWWCCKSQHGNTHINELEINKLLINIL